MILVADILIWLLLAAGVGFGALGLFGLVIFPDIRSRMYTAVRATLIGVTSITVSVLLYAGSLYLETGEGQYATLALEVVFLYAILVIGTVLLDWEIQDQIRAP
jgi:multicomponent Na+:H+ antiporter subunit G